MGNGFNMKITFPVSYLSSQLSMTGLLVALGLGGKPHLATDVAIVQGAALALFFAFSGNARNLMFKSGGVAYARSIIVARLMLMLPLAAGVFYLGSTLGGVAWDISLILILRKSVEWLSEVHLSEVERDQDVVFAWRHLATQSGLLVMSAIWAITETPGLLLVLTAWAIVPLIISFPYLQRVLRGATTTRISVSMLLPHLGSTAVMGIGVYVFRLTILLLVDRSMAGSLYTAFAIGGIMGSVFAMGLGPSMVLHEQKTGRMQMPVWMRTALAMVTLAGIAVIAIAHSVPDMQAFAGKDMLFWQALGYSLIGGVVMVFAQRQRLRDLQHGTQDDVFAPDVLVNMLIVIFIPTIFFIFGNYGLTWLYLFNATVALVFYWMTDVERAMTIIGRRYTNMLRVVIAALLVMPIFVNLETGLFRSPLLNYDSGGALSKLPIPLSVFACYAGIALLGNYRQAKLGLGMIFGCFVLMVLSTVATAYNNPSEQQAKLILLAQYILPMFGLVLGMMYGGNRRNEYLVEKAMLIAIAVLVPAQLVATWAQGHMLLTPYLYLFSIYQHLQYVPVIVACSYIVGLYGLWEQPRWRRLIITLAPMIGIYAMASSSILAVMAVVMGCACFLANRVSIDVDKKGHSWEWIVATLVLVSGSMYLLLERLPNHWVSWTRAGDLYENSKYIDPAMFYVLDRIDYWHFYLSQIFSDASTLLLGHSTPPDRNVLTSAHNYYLDYIYNYGAIAAFAIIGMVIFTVIRLYQNRKLILLTPSLTGLALAVLFLLIPDSLLKVGMRQPYPGIFSFFLWGLLLARIESLRSRQT
jgi:hypothetical protein